MLYYKIKDSILKQKSSFLLLDKLEDKNVKFSVGSK